MSDNTLTAFSDQLADVIAAAAPAVVQVRGRRRPASGIVFAEDAVLTTGRALGGENGVSVQAADGRRLDAEPVGWDPATHLVALRVPGLDTPAATPADGPARVGHLVVAIGRSWSNAVTATLGNVAIIGGPLPTGRGRTIREVIRTTAPMHGGFTGGGLVDTLGHVVGVTTAAEIRGLRVAIPAPIAWTVGREILERGHVKRGYLGLAGQRVQLGVRQREAGGPDTGLLVLAVTPDSPADQAGLFVGDIVASLDGIEIDSTDRLLEALTGDRVGRTVTIGIVRGGDPSHLSVTVGERPQPSP